MNQNEIFTRLVDRDPAMGLLIKTADSKKHLVGKGIEVGKNLVDKMLGKSTKDPQMWLPGLEPDTLIKKIVRTAKNPNVVIPLAGTAIGVPVAANEISNARQDAAARQTQAAETSTKSLFDGQAIPTAAGTQEAAAQKPATQATAKPANEQKPAENKPQDADNSGKETKQEENKTDIKKWLDDENNQWSLGLGAAGGLGLYGALGFVPGLEKKKNRLLRALIAAAGGVGIGYGVNNLLTPDTTKTT